MNVLKSGTSPRQARGLSLIELMIAIALGVLVVLAAMGIFASNKAAFRSTDSLGVLQENARTSFELMARDVREAGGNPCLNTLAIANVVNTSGTSWWSNFTDWGQVVRGYGSAEAFPNASFGTGSGERLTGTDAIQLISGDYNVASVSTHNASTGTFTLNRTDHGIAAGDLVLACDQRQAAVFQVSGVSGATLTYSAGGTPGNCSINLSVVGVGEACSTREPFVFVAPTAVVTKLNASRWFLATNPNGRPSLYHTRLAGGTVATEEVVEGVSAMNITYLVSGAANYVNAAGVGGNWPAVIAARINLTVDGQPNTGVGGQVQRQLFHVVTLRNRNP